MVSSVGDRGAAAVCEPGLNRLIVGDELLQRVTVGGDNSLVAAGGPGHLADVNRALRIDADAMGREEITRSAGVPAAAPSRQEFAVAIEDTDAAADRVGVGRRHARPEAGAETEFGDVNPDRKSVV